MYDLSVGMEAIETAINFWEDALEAYRALSKEDRGALAVTTAEEAEFTRDLQHLLESGYKIQGESEMLFLDQVFISLILLSLNKNKTPFVPINFRGQFCSALRARRPAALAPPPAGALTQAGPPETLGPPRKMRFVLWRRKKLITDDC